MTDADWDWCVLVILSATLVQKPDFKALIGKAVGFALRTRRQPKPHAAL